MLNTRVYVFKTHPLFKHAIRTHAGVCYIFNFMSCFLAEGLELHCYLWGLWSSKAVKMTQTGRIWTWGGKKMVQAVKSRFFPHFSEDWLKCRSAKVLTPARSFLFSTCSEENLQTPSHTGGRPSWAELSLYGYLTWKVLLFKTKLGTIAPLTAPVQYNLSTDRLQRIFISQL